MPRIEPPRAEEITPEAHAVWEAFYHKRGSVPNMFRTLSLRPDMARATAACMDAILGTGTVELRLKEMVAVRVSQLNTCAY
ncbi:MAG TPA: carboxymuconolactone decarboxylase family protein [Herpetosiphonaceae bacterium]